MVRGEAGCLQHILLSESFLMDGTTNTKVRSAAPATCLSDANISVKQTTNKSAAAGGGGSQARYKDVKSYN